MKIYTGDGDKGDTSILGGKKVPKSSACINACGDIDELNAQLGVVRALKPALEIESIVEEVQNHLFRLASEVVASGDAKCERIQSTHIKYLEDTIDKIDSQLPPLRSFIYPGGNQVSAQLHVARTICRRAERSVDALHRQGSIGNLPLIYLNRLSDLLFVLARYENKLSNINEKEWKQNRGKNDRI